MYVRQLSVLSVHMAGVLWHTETSRLWETRNGLREDDSYRGHSLARTSQSPHTASLVYRLSSRLTKARHINYYDLFSIAG